LEELGGDGEEEQDRDEGQADVGGHQLELERRAQDAVAALDEQLEDVAQEDEEDGQDQDDVDVPEDEQEDPVGDQDRRQVAPALQEVEEAGEDEQETGQAGEDQPVVLAVALELLAQVHGGPGSAPARDAELVGLLPVGGDGGRNEGEEGAGAELGPDLDQDAAPRGDAF